MTNAKIYPSQIDKIKTVYVVTSGEYSNYKIEFVITDKAFAERFMMLRGPSISGYQIEEYDLIRAEDHDLEKVAQAIWDKPIFRVSMKKEGEVVRCERDAHSWSHEEAVRDIVLGDYESGIKPCARDRLSIRVFARDKKHAIKITNEIRTRLIAENKWPETEKD